MTQELSTERARLLLQGIKNDCRRILHLIDRLEFGDIPVTASAIRDRLHCGRMENSKDDSFLNDLFVLESYVNLLEKYGRYWHHIISGESAASWSALQDVIDYLRLVKKFSGINVAFFERQLVQLETIYPYLIFFSVGLSVSRFECSICGEDIESFRCPHRRGELYMGEMAVAIARDGIDLDHVSAVENPVDKRCVPSYPDESPGFNAVRYLGELVNSGEARISSISGFSEKRVFDPNPDYIKKGRNEPCFCGSGKKFKKCCIDKHSIERRHVDIIGRPCDLADIVP